MTFCSHLGLFTTIDPPTHDNEELVYTVLTNHVLQTAMRQFSIQPLIRQDYEKVLYMYIHAKHV